MEFLFSILSQMDDLHAMVGFRVCGKRRFPQVFNHFFVAFKIAVRKVLAGHIHTGPNHFRYGFTRCGGRTYGATNLCFILREHHELFIF